MCNLYRMTKEVSDMARAFDAYVPRGMNFGSETYPTYPGVVVRQVDGERIAQQMTWGFPLRLKNMKTDSKPKPVTNARDDKLMTPFWKRWFVGTEYRCLIPFTEFAEAEGPKGKMTRTWIGVRDQSLAAWAGLWRPSDEWGDVYTGVMVDATKELWDIHDRMPVILRPDDHDTWLNAHADEAMGLLQQYPADQLVVERTAEAWARR